MLVILGAPSAAAAEVADYLGYAKSSSMYSNTINTVNSPTGGDPSTQSTKVKLKKI